MPALQDKCRRHMRAFCCSELGKRLYGRLHRRAEDPSGHRIKRGPSGQSLCERSTALATYGGNPYNSETLVQAGALLPDPVYSIVIPAYNEEARLPATLEKVLAFVHEQRWAAEVLVVNDGSGDATVDIVRRAAAREPALRLIENPGNRGKGYSVRNGMLQARGSIVLFSDADLSAPISEAPKLFAALAGGADVAIGSRWMQAELQTRRQSWLRQFLGRVFNLLARVLLGLRFHDTQCGFKAFTREAAQAIFPLQKIERWGFDPEILFLARKLGYTVEEVPVLWGHSGGERIHPLRDGTKMLLEMLRIRSYAIRGDYDTGGAAEKRAQPAKKAS